MSSGGPGGLIFGYSTLSERTITEGIGVLAEVIDEVRSGRASPIRRTDG
jgi:GntR family transcriptional regulator/MocR family aminotransferase